MDFLARVHNPDKKLALGRCGPCDLAFCYRARAKVNRASVICPKCSLPLDVTTRRLKAGFVELSDAEIDAIVDLSHFGKNAEIVRLARRLLKANHEAWEAFRRDHAEVRKAQAQKIEREAQPVSEFVGEIGGKVELEVKVLAIRTVESDYGLSYLCLFSAGGNILKWFASRKPDFFAEGDVVKIIGTVKGHEVYRDVKQTSILRVKQAFSPEEIKAQKLAAKVKNLAVKAAKQAMDDVYAAECAAIAAVRAKYPSGYGDRLAAGVNGDFEAEYNAVVAEYSEPKRISLENYWTVAR